MMAHMPSYQRLIVMETRSPVEAIELYVTNIRYASN